MVHLQAYFNTKGLIWVIYRVVGEGDVQEWIQELLGGGGQDFRFQICK